MNNIISFIIPSYNEKEKDIFPLLSSIANQLGIEKNLIEVIIVRDGTQELNIKQFNIFNLNIYQILMKENGGPGVARQKGLDAAAGKYVMFCDADDILHSVGIIGAMIQEMENQNWDILKTPWLEEYLDPNTNKLIYINHEIENTWMHGKMFRRSFLQNNNISFHPLLRVHEDTYFNCIAAEYTTKMGFLNVTSYVWKWGKDSITRREDGIYRYESSIEFIKACTWAHERVEIINPIHMDYKIVQFIIYHYFCLHSNYWLEKKYKKYYEDTEKAFIEYIKPFWKYWERANPELIVKTYNEEREKNFINQIEDETLNDWLQRLGLGQEEKE